MATHVYLRPYREPTHKERKRDEHRRTHSEHHGEEKSKRRYEGHHDTSHNGTHPHRTSHHSGTHISNPNVVHHHEVHHSEHSTAAREKIRKGNSVKQALDKAATAAAKSGTTGKNHTNPTPPRPGTTAPKTGSIPTPSRNPLLNIARGVTSGASTTAPKTTAPSQQGNKTTGQAPYHHGIDYGIGNPDPNRRPYGANEPAQGLATQVSAVTKSGKSPTYSTMQEGDPQVTQSPGQILHHIGHEIFKAFANAGVYEENVTGYGNPYTHKPAQYYNDTTNKTPETAAQVVRDAWNGLGDWERSTLDSYGIHVTPYRGNWP